MLSLSPDEARFLFSWPCPTTVSRGTGVNMSGECLAGLFFPPHTPKVECAVGCFSEHWSNVQQLPWLFQGVLGSKEYRLPDV